MKLDWFNLIIGIALITILSSCQEDIKVNLPSAGKKIVIEGNIEKMESLSSSMDTFWYYLMHKGENVYKVPCVRCEKPLLVFLRPDPSIGFVPKCCSPIAT